MEHQMWFGTREKMRWILCPAVEMDSPSLGWGSQTDFLSGRAHVRRSNSDHREFTMAWNMKSREDLRPIMDYAKGHYGRGLIYWGDPFTMDANMLNDQWATPWLGATDGLILDGKDARPELVKTPQNDYGYPVDSVRYNVDTTTSKPSIWIPAPPDYVLWVGAHGQDGTGGKVVVTPTTGATTYSTAVTLTTMGVDENRVNASFDSADFTGIEVSLGGAGTITLSGLIVQALPRGAEPSTGDFISGQGHSGCKFYPMPSFTPYSAALDKVSMAATLVESD